MTKDINSISIVGNLVCDPEFRETNGKLVAFVRVATGQFNVRNNDDEDRSTRKETTVHEVRVYVDHIVNLLTDIRKGDRVVIWGEMRNSREGSYIILLAPHARFYQVT